MGDTAHRMAPHTDWNGMSRTLLAPLWLLFNFHHMTNAQTTVPPGCGQGLNELYFNLCDLKAVWGIVLQAITSAGIVASFILTIVLVASTPFIQDKKKKSMLGTQVFFLLGTLGLFGLVFDMVIKKDFSTCTSRMFLFGVLFAICFSCLWAHGVNLNYLVRKNNGPSGWWIFVIAVCLSLVEVIINTEWLIILLVRTTILTKPCYTENMDFVMALIYVMFLIIAGFVTAWPALCGKYGHWRRHAIFILITLFMSAAIWIVWIIMYIYGNEQVGNLDKWDDPTLAIALVSNAWAFIFFYIIPELSQLTKQSMEQTFEEDLYPTRGVGYETILKEQTSQSMYVENKAFSMDEPTSAAKRPVSPYSGYNGQIRSSVYQPTEMALMNKGMPELPYDVIIPRATANTHPVASGTSTIRAEDAYAAQNRNRSNPAAKNTQAHSPYPQW